MNISSEQILERVSKVVFDVLKIPPEKITRESKFKEDLGADSLDIVSLLMALEDEFKSPISDEEAATFINVGAVVDFIAVRLASSSPA